MCVFSNTKGCNMSTAITEREEGDIASTARQAGSFLPEGELADYGVEWTDCSKVTPMGGMAYFGHFLRTNGLFDYLVQRCPLTYVSNNAPGKRRVLGTVVAGVMNGAWRYAHLSHIQGDRLCAELLEIEGGFVSEDSVRRGLRRGVGTDWAAWDQWLSETELVTVLPLLSEAYTLDLDSSVKLVYGHQEGADIAYNPSKPGRPSQAIHLGFIGGLRLLVAVDVQGGKKHAACHMAPRIWTWVDALPYVCRPRLIRGDIGFGNEGYLCKCEARDLPYLFKLKMTAKVKKAIQEMATQQGKQWRKTLDEWEVIETRLKLQGWSRDRRVVVLRRPSKAKPSTCAKDEDWLPHMPTDEASIEWEYAALVCSEDLPLESLAKLYADRADCENVIDELKNQWGLNGFSTRDLNRCKIMARLTALVCNWWNVFVRIAEPREHKEAITSRPELLHVIATLVTHAGKKVLRFCSHHENSQGVKRAFGRLHRVFSRIETIAGQLNRQQVWTVQLSVAFYAWLRGKLLKVPSVADKTIRELAPSPAPVPI
jgi:hypothetical protein